jgi:hypothetical protein
MDLITRSDFEKAIGQLSISWALAEHALDRCIGVIFYAKGGDQIEKELPLNARSKIKFFRKACNTLEFCKDDVEHANEMANHAYKTLDDRNWCIHGAALTTAPEFFSAEIEMIRFSRPHMGELETRTVTIKEIEAIRMDCLRLLFAFGFFLYKPLNALSKEHVQNVLDDAGIEFPL